MSAKRTAAAAHAVTAAFLPMEDAATLTAEHGARCILTMIEQRREARLHPSIGSDVLILVAQSTVDALNAHRKLASAHAKLSTLSKKLEVGFGDDGCPDNQPSGEIVRIVRAA